MRIEFIDRIRLGLLFGWSWLPAEDEFDFYELNIYFLFFGLHITWGHEEEV
tara:strand:+ start:790 stop:942 length:153 start_codon:yes stop_codon:yes gene_type:complete